MTEVTQEDLDYHRLNSRIRPLEEIGSLCQELDISLVIDHKNFICSDRKGIKLSTFLRKIGCSKHLKYIKSGTTGHTFCSIWCHKDNEECTIPLAVKVSGYSKTKNYGNPDEDTRPENAEIRMLCLLSEFVLDEKCPHIVLPFVAFRSPLEPFIEIRIPDKIDESVVSKYKKFTEKAKTDKFYDHASVLISEWCNGGDLSRFIKRHQGKISLEVWRSIFFQITVTLAIIQEKYPSFRHNDLKPNNILVNVLKDRSPVPLEYTVYGKKYILPCVGLIIKIWDFDFACISGFVENKKLEQEWTKKLKIISKEHKYYDLHYFFNTLGNKAFYPHLLEPGGAPYDVQTFVRRVVPKKYSRNKNYVHGRSHRLHISEEFTTPKIIIENDIFFKDFRVE